MHSAQQAGSSSPTLGRLCLVGQSSAKWAGGRAGFPEPLQQTCEGAPVTGSTGSCAACRCHRSQGMPLSAGPWSMAAYILALVVTGLLITWADSACNNPIFAIIVPTHMRNLIYSFGGCLGRQPHCDIQQSGFAGRWIGDTEVCKRTAQLYVE